MSECPKRSRERSRNAVVDSVDSVRGRYIRICRTVESLDDDTTGQFRLAGTVSYDKAPECTYLAVLDNALQKIQGVIVIIGSYFRRRNESSWCSCHVACQHHAG